MTFAERQIIKMIQKRYVDTAKLITNTEKLKLTAAEVLIYYGDKWYGEVAIDLEGKEEKFEELKSAIIYVAKNLYKMDLIAQEYIALHGDSRFADGYEVAYIRFDTLDEISVTYYGIQMNTEFDVVFQCVNNDFLLKSFGRNKNIPSDWNKK